MLVRYLAPFSSSRFVTAIICLCYNEFPVVNLLEI